MNEYVTGVAAVATNLKHDTMKKLLKQQMKQCRGGTGAARNTCSTKTTCEYYDYPTGLIKTAVCQNRQVAPGVWDCRCGRSDTPCTDEGYW
jgi:hypothetical protein